MCMDNEPKFLTTETTGQTEETKTTSKICCIGIGDGGINSVNRMKKAGLKGVELWAVNTDDQILETALVKNQLAIGKNITNGLGCGGNLEKGEKAAEEDKSEIAEITKNADVVFVVACLGGGTGTGAAPVVAKIAKESGALTIGIVTKPFGFEGHKRMQKALQGIDKLKENVDALTVLSNDDLFENVDRNMTMKEVFQIPVETILRSIRAISDIINFQGLINVELKDIKKILKSSVIAAVGTGSAEGEKRAEKAAREAIGFLKSKNKINKAKGAIINVTGGKDMNIFEITEAAKVISDILPENAEIQFGAIVDDEMNDEIKVTVIATGCD